MFGLAVALCVLAEGSVSVTLYFDEEIRRQMLDDKHQGHKVPHHPPPLPLLVSALYLSLCLSLSLSLSHLLCLCLSVCLCVTRATKSMPHTRFSCASSISEMEWW